MFLGLFHYAIMASVVSGLLAWAVAPYSVLAKNYVYKMSLFFYGGVCMLFSTDKSWKKAEVPDPKTALGGNTKRIIFVRHGESEWNLIFNKGVAKLLPRLIAAWCREMVMLVTCDSIFFDSPLNDEGISQAKELSDFLCKDHAIDTPALGDIQALQGQKGQSILCSSTLRRAISTLCAALWEPRIRESGEDVVLLSACQEISRNVDTISLAPKHGVPVLPHTEKALDGFKATTTLTSEYNYGNKPVFGTGLTRMQSFAAWAMARPESTIIVGGHSLWFRFFFQTFLPRDENPHQAKTLKVHNTGVVAFDLVGRDGAFKILPKSVTVVYRGFDDKKKKMKKKI